MKISFVIPAYNEEYLLPKCLEAIQEELKAGSYDAEVIVVNNASTDGTRKAAERFPFAKIVDEPRKGLTRARQSGFEVSSGDLIANIDADTMITREWIPTVLNEFEKDPQLVALSGPFDYYDLPPLKRLLARLFIATYPVVNLIIYHLLGASAMLQGGNFVLRRDALRAVGGFDTSIAFYGEDTDIAKRIAKVGKVTWTLRLPIRSSGRRLLHEGLVQMGIKYAVNYFSTVFSGKPWHEKYTDVRPRAMQQSKAEAPAGSSAAHP